MGLIINKTIQQLMTGYPTVSDKYNVGGGILEGSTAVRFGDLVQKGTNPGYYAPATSVASVDDILGFVVSTNVKLVENWPGTTVQVNPGEAFNILINGFIAIELDDDASTVSKAAVAAVGAASADTDVAVGKTYYTRASSSVGAGALNDGTYAYTKVASPTGNPSTSSYYELSVLGSDALTNYVVPNGKVHVILATGKCTTSDKASSGTIVELPYCTFTGIIEYHGGKKLAEIFIR